MAQTYDKYTVGSSGQAGPYTYNFTPLSTADIKVSVDNVVKTVTTDYTVDTVNSRITFVSGKEPSTGQKVIVYRDTPDTSSPYVLKDLQSGSTIRASELNSNYKQLLYIAEEQGQSLSTVIPMTMETDIHLGQDNNIIFEGSTNNDFETTLTVAGPAADHIITLPSVTGTVVTTGDIGSVTSTMIADLHITNTDISATAEIDVSKLGDGLPRQVLQTNADNTTVAWTSDIDLPGTLDVTGAATFDTSAIVNGVLDVNGSATIDNVQINGNEVDTTSGGLTIDSASGTTTVDDQLVVTGQVTANGTLVAADLSGAAVVTSGVSSSDTKVYSAKRTEDLFLRQDSSETLASGVAWASSDATVPTTAAIDARVRTLITDVGGFRAIANEASFPTTNPDPDDNAGTIVSITALSGNRTASGTTLTAGCQTTAGTQVTITGCPSGQVFKQNYGILVETTSTLNTYTFVRYLADTSSVATISTKAAEIGRLGTTDAITDLAILGSNDTVADMAMLATADIVADMNTLAVTAVVDNMATIANNSGAVVAVGSDLANNYSNVTDYGSITAAVTATSGTSDITTVANSIANVNTVSPIAANVTTVAGIAANVTTVAGNTTNINAVAADATDIGAVAAKATEIGRLGSADTIADMVLLGTTAVVEDMGLLGSAACVEDMAILGTADTVADMALLGTADVVADLNTLGTADVVSDLNTLGTADVVSDMNTLANAAIISDMDTLADISGHVTTVANNNANVTTCALDILNINSASSYATNAATHADNAYTHMVNASAHRTQAESVAYNLVDSASTHTAWGDITDSGSSYFANESDNILLTMSEGTATYNYGSIT